MRCVHGKVSSDISHAQRVEGLTFADAKRMLGTILANEMDGIIISKQVMHLRTRIRHISLKCLQVRMRI